MTTYKWKGGKELFIYSTMNALAVGGGYFSLAIVGMILDW